MLLDHVYNRIEDNSGLILFRCSTESLGSSCEQIVIEQNGRDHRRFSVLPGHEYEGFSEPSEAGVLMNPAVNVGKDEHLPRLKVKQLPGPLVFVLFKHL